MTKTIESPQKRRLDYYVDFTCPGQTTVGKKFSVQGTAGSRELEDRSLIRKVLAWLRSWFAKLLGLASGPYVVCKVAYTDAHGTNVAQCMQCTLSGANWCCQFDLSGNPPGSNSIGLVAALYNPSKQSEKAIMVGYDARKTTDPCSCSGGFTVLSSCPSDI